MLNDVPNFVTINRLLMNVGSALSNTAKYFHLLIKASAPSPIDEEQSFKDFWALLMTRRI